ncbi:hypothetical protein ABIE12_004540 [Serratia sp. 509]
MANKFILGKRSITNLRGARPELVSVVRRAIELTSIDFTVIEGVRIQECQR